MNTTNSKIFHCPYCGEIIKKGNGHHIRQCELRWLSENFTEEYKQQLYNLYIVNQLSIRETAEKLCLTSTQVTRFLDYAGIPQRTVKEAVKTNRKRELSEQTSLQRYGAKHNFCKNSESRKKWEKRLLEEEGITNVFQRKSVIQKIQQTLIQKYGKEGLKYQRFKGCDLAYCIQKYGEEEGIKYYNWILKQKANNTKEYYIEKYGEEIGLLKREERALKQKKSVQSSRWDGLNNKFTKLLDERGISYEREVPFIKEDLKWYVYDFVIGNIVVELNGIYWHCSPKLYKPNDLVKFPNNVYIKAKDKWEYDDKKLQFIKDKGYECIIIWEDEIDNIDEKIFNRLKYESSKN